MTNERERWTIEVELEGAANPYPEGQRLTMYPSLALTSTHGTVTRVTKHVVERRVGDRRRGCGRRLTGERRHGIPL